jgi:HAMP domain-containing protein
MEKTINFEMTDSDFRKFEKLLDSTLEVMHRLEKDSPQRENNILKSQAETLELKSEINQQLNSLENKIGKFRTV